MGTVPVIVPRDDALRLAFVGIRKSLENPRPFQEAIAEILFRRAGQSFEDEESPSGVPWKPLSPAYSFWKKNIAKKGQQGILRLSGAMFRSLDRGVRGDRAFVIARTKYAITHQEGRVFPPIPARPFMGFPKQDQAEAATAIETTLEGLS